MLRHLNRVKGGERMALCLPTNEGARLLDDMKTTTRLLTETFSVKPGTGAPGGLKPLKPDRELASTQDVGHVAVILTGDGFRKVSAASARVFGGQNVRA